MCWWPPTAGSSWPMPGWPACSEPTCRHRATTHSPRPRSSPPTKRSDFYSLGCLLYALLTGRPPFTAANLVELIHKHCFVMPERPIHFVPDLPEEVDNQVMKLLAKDPQVRPGSGTLLLADLERVWSSLETRGKLGKRPALP